MKINCWEHQKCGRQPGGSNVSGLGVCPASTEQRLDGVHDGKNGGRACWVIAGTMCGGEVQGTFGKKFKNCEQCEFYKRVRIEESLYFCLSVVLLEKLKSKPRPSK